MEEFKKDKTSLEMKLVELIRKFEDKYDVSVDEIEFTKAIGVEHQNEKTIKVRTIITI